MARSVARPMMPPSASTSRTTVPLATPPIAGLQDIWPMRFERTRDQRDARAEARGRDRGFRPGVPTTDYENVKRGFHVQRQGVGGRER